MIPLKVIAEYKLWRNGEVVESDRKEIMVADEKELEEE